MISWVRRATHSCLFLILFFASCSLALAEQAPLMQQIERLDNDFKTLSAKFYRDSSSKTGKTSKKYSNVDLLLNNVNKLINAKQPVRAIQLLNSNIQTINENIDSKAVFEIIDILLDQNHWVLANSLFQTIQEEGDLSLLAPVKYSFARYHAQRNQWKQVVKLLDGIFSQLSDDNATYAYLLYGTALQHLKKHRLAVQSYEKISKKSKYYRYAQLNTAIANIRQGWWTDAQTRIDKLLKYSKKTNKDELTNRLYLILGYALLQREFYRDARDAFRHIGLNSQYTNRALLGIGLTATSQGDYIGGLNALTILKDKKTFDLSVDESYLLVPYVYEKLQQELTVNTSYTEAMNYYQRRIKELDNIISRKADLSKVSYSENTMSISVKNNNFDYSSQYPESFIKNFNRLNYFKNMSKASKLKNKISKLTSRYESVYQKIINDLAAQRKENLRSYLNQSRYGLARLYDNSKESSN